MVLICKEKRWSLLNPNWKGGSSKNGRKIGGAGTKEGEAEFRFCHRDGLLRHRLHQHTLVADYYWTPLACTHTFRHWPRNSTLPPGIIRHLCATPSIFKIPESGHSQIRGLQSNCRGLILKEELGLNRHPQKVSIACHILLGRGHVRRCQVPSSLETAVPEQSEEPSGEDESLNWWVRLPRNRQMDTRKS